MQALNIAFLIYQGISQPFKSKLERRLEMINETLIGFIFISLTCHTDAVIVSNTRFQLAWLTLGLLQVLITINLCLVTFFQCYSYKLIVEKYARKLNCYCKWCEKLKLPECCGGRKKQESVKEGQDRGDE